MVERGAQGGVDPWEEQVGSASGIANRFNGIIRWIEGSSVISVRRILMCSPGD